MWQWIIIGIAVLAIVGGFWLFMDNQLSAKDDIIEEKDKKITELQADVAAKKVDIENLKTSVTTLSQTLDIRNQQLRESQAQANRIKEQDAKERARQAEFEKKVEGINSKNQKSLDAINAYQSCIARNVNDETCAKLLE